MGYLVVLFTVLPLLELWLLLLIGDAIGFWATVGLTLGTAVLGAYLAKREGARVIRQWRQAMAELRMPEEGIVSGLLVLVGGVLLASPGVITDLFGILLLFPPTRRRIARMVSDRVEEKIRTASASGALKVRVVGFAGPSADDDGVHETQDVIDTEAEEITQEAPKLLPKGN